MDLVIYALLFVAVAIMLILLKIKNTAPDFNDLKKVINQADVYLAYGQTDKARDILTRALEVHPQNGELVKRLESI